VQIGKTRLRKRVAGLSYGGTAIASLVLGGIYAFKGSFMPYHADALSKSWGELEPASQVLISALMRVAGGGWITLGVVILTLLVVPFRNDRRWAVYALPAIILLFYIPTLSATVTVLQNTPANPPWQGTLLACLAAVFGLVLYPGPLEDTS
jgi:hypothetical protein